MRPAPRRPIGLAAAVLAFAAWGWGAPPAARSAAPPLDGREIVARSLRALHYAGEDMRARMRLEIVDGTTRRLRGMTVLRKDLAEGGEQLYLLYFHEPGDVRRMTCMVKKHIGAPDGRWIYVPAVKKVRHIGAPERSPFLASDFVREEFSGRDVDADTHALVREETMNGRTCFVVRSTPRERAEFSRYDSWIDRETFLPLRQEFRNEAGEVARIFEGGAIETVRASGSRKSYPILRERTMRTPVENRYSRLIVETADYDIGLTTDDFSEAHMAVPLASWLP